MFISRKEFEDLKTALKHESEERFKLQLKYWELEKKVFSLARTLGYELQQPSGEVIWEQIAKK